MLIAGDCLDIMRGMEPESADMAYLDPPFFTQKVQSMRSRDGELYEFSDVWPSLDDYISFMRDRLIEIRRILRETGSVFLHCGSNISHHLRILLDEVFGAGNFRGEIIWSYRRWSNSAKGLLPGHQTIFFYSKSAEYRFTTIYRDYSPSTNIDQILQERARRADGKTVYRRDESGNAILCSGKRGVPLSDVWEIPFLNPKAKERTGYPTQKPVELLERIIRISTDPGDTIIDPFCGSGTALVAASLLGRKHIGIDSNPAAIAICRQRLETPAKTESALLRKGLQSYMTKTEEEISILSQFDCDIVQRNKGIDAIMRRFYGGAPAAIRIQKDGESASEAASLLMSSGRKKGCGLLVLILRHGSEAELEDIPDDMIVLMSYEGQLRQKISRRRKAAGTADCFFRFPSPCS